jgi:hypothetical protein
MNFQKVLFCLLSFLWSHHGLAADQELPIVGCLPVSDYGTPLPAGSEITVSTGCFLTQRTPTNLTIEFLRKSDSENEGYLTTVGHFLYLTWLNHAPPRILLKLLASFSIVAFEKTYIEMLPIGADVLNQLINSDPLLSPWFLILLDLIEAMGVSNLNEELSGLKLNEPALAYRDDLPPSLDLQINQAKRKKVLLSALFFFLSEFPNPFFRMKNFQENPQSVFPVSKRILSVLLSKARPENLMDLNDAILNF